MQQLVVLRKCRICGAEANSVEELNKFHKYEGRPFDRENLCKACENATLRTGGRYWSTVKRCSKRSQIKHNPQRITFQGKPLYLGMNPRTNICSKCGRKYPTELKRQTIMHHDEYIVGDPLACTIELCGTCHAEVHGFGTKIRSKRWG